MEVRERIRIDGKPISKEMFAKYFFEVWDKLDNTGVSQLREHPRSRKQHQSGVS
jgi:folylpolyglutamate synthase